MTIRSEGAANTIVDGADQVTVFQVTGVKVKIARLRIRESNAKPGVGLPGLLSESGGVENEGNLLLSEDVLIGRSGGGASRTSTVAGGAGPTRYSPSDKKRPGPASSTASSRACWALPRLHSTVLCGDIISKEKAGEYAVAADDQGGSRLLASRAPAGFVPTGRRQRPEPARLVLKVMESAR